MSKIPARGNFVLTSAELDTIAEALHLASETLSETASAHAIRNPRAAVVERLRRESDKLERIADRIDAR